MLNSYTEFSHDAPPSPSPRIPDPNDPPWSIFGAVGVWLASVFFLALLPALFVIIYAQQRGVGLAEVAHFSLNDNDAIFVQIIANIPAHLLTILLAWMLVTRLGKRPFLGWLGWHWGTRFGFWTSAGVAVGLLLIGLGVIRLLGGPETQLDRIINSSRATAVMMAFIATVTAPLVEEVV
ncbi:MAG TPA: hypothetical protein VF754_10190, partial [Pyrinomonadaceae bacterium]